jgi:hypothetical protein
MSYETVARIKKFFKGLTVALLMPVAILAGVSVGALFALLLGMAMYVALIFAALRWIVRSAWTLLFGKAARANGADQRPAPATAVEWGPPSRDVIPGQGLRVQTPDPCAHEREVWDGRQAAHRKRLQ